MKKFISAIFLITCVLAIIGGIVVVKKTLNTSSNVVEGIAGYRRLVNKHYKPYFTANLPSNWRLEEYPLVDAKGRWISLRGPLNKSQTRYTSLDIYLIEKSNSPKYKSLDAFVTYTTKQESIGETDILIDRERVVAGVNGREIKIASRRTIPAQSGSVDVTIIKQWITLMKEDHILMALYESPKEDFDSYFEVYQTMLESLSFVQ